MDLNRILDQKLRLLLENQLAPGEEVLWSDQPLPRLIFSAYTTVQMVLGIVCFIVLFYLAREFEISIPDVITLKAVLIGLIYSVFFLPLPVLLFAAPWLERRRMHHTAYALTNHRALSVRKRRSPWISSVPFDAVRQIRIKIKPDGVGDVTIVAGARVVGETDADFKEGFFHIRNPQTVAKQIESQVHAITRTKVDANAETSKQDPPSLVVEDIPTEGETITPLYFLKVLVAFCGVLLVFLGVPAAFAWATNTGWAGSLFLFFLLFSLLMLRGVVWGRQSSGWPTTQGRIKTCYIRRDSRSDRYKFRVEYTYQVDGKEYWNNAVSAKQQVTELTRTQAEAIVTPYPQGQEVMVYYHPRKPGYAFLEPGGDKAGVIGTAVLCACCLAAGIWMMVSWQGFDSVRFANTWLAVKHYIRLQ